jgi:hypothetical protein
MKQLPLLHQIAQERRRVFIQAHLSGNVQLTRLMKSAAGEPFEEYGNLYASNVSFKLHRHPLDHNAVKPCSRQDLRGASGLPSAAA